VKVTVGGGLVAVKVAVGGGLVAVKVTVGGGAVAVKVAVGGGSVAVKVAVGGGSVAVKVAVGGGSVAVKVAVGGGSVGIAVAVSVACVFTVNARAVPAKCSKSATGSRSVIAPYSPPKIIRKTIMKKSLELRLRRRGWAARALVSGEGGVVARFVVRCAVERWRAGRSWRCDGMAAARLT